MTPRRLYRHEALELLETVFEVGPDGTSDTAVDATLAGFDVAQAQADVDFWIGMQGAQIDAESITITPDTLDDSDMPAARIIIKTESGE